MKTKLRKTYNILIRSLIILLTIGFIYEQLFYEKDLQPLIEFIPSITSNTSFVWLLILAGLLMTVNLFTEIWKWKFLINKLEKVSWWNAIKAVLTGISISMFLPNRVGDYLGRVFILRKADRMQAVLATVLGSLAQLLTTIIFGLVAGLLFFPLYFELSVALNQWIFSGLIILVAFSLFILLFLYLNFSAFTTIIKRISGKYFIKIEKYIQVFSWYSSRDLSKVLMISILRYLVFSFQFYLLLVAFGVPVNYIEAMMLVCLVYIMMTIIPTVALTEIGVRGSVSLFVFQLFLAPKELWSESIGLGVAAASTVLWLINLALPALLGIVFVYSLRFFRKNNGNHL